MNYPESHLHGPSVKPRSLGFNEPFAGAVLCGCPEKDSLRVTFMEGWLHVRKFLVTTFKNMDRDPYVPIPAKHEP